jgi:excisionase family DNA binding protein
VPTIRRYVRSGRLPFVRIGNQIRFDLTDANVVFVVETTAP